MGKAGEMSTADLLLADEEFHRRLISLSRNKELCSFMEIITRRIHVARHIDIQQTIWNTTAFDAHLQVTQCLIDRDAQRALDIMTQHIDMSLKRAIEITKEMVARFFLVEAAAMSERLMPIEDIALSSPQQA